MRYLLVLCSQNYLLRTQIGFLISNQLELTLHYLPLDKFSYIKNYWKIYINII